MQCIQPVESRERSNGEYSRSISRRDSTRGWELANKTYSTSERRSPRDRFPRNKSTQLIASPRKKQPVAIAAGGSQANIRNGDRAYFLFVVFFLSFIFFSLYFLHSNDRTMRSCWFIVLRCNYVEQNDTELENQFERIVIRIRLAVSSMRRKKVNI